jgi:hypothetical protein
VAEAMKERQKTAKARYVINVGDSFYWGGLEDTSCGGDPKKVWDLNKPSNQGGGNQIKEVFEEMYDIPHPLDPSLQIPWLGILGNHDYGGMHLDSGWDHMIWYTYKDEGKGRWRMPGQYWRQTVEYRTFKVDWFFLDGNYIDAVQVGTRRGHNVCYGNANQACYSADAGYENIFFETHNKNKAHGNGKLTLHDCPRYFQALWSEQIVWLGEKLKSSTAHWTALVAHYPNNWDEPRITELIDQYHVDMVMAGHTHYQVFTQAHGDENNDAPKIKGCEVQKGCSPDKPCHCCPLRFISGGGGGIASEHNPTENNNAYGFFEVTLTKDEIVSAAIIGVNGQEVNLPPGAGIYKNFPRKIKFWEGGEKVDRPACRLSTGIHNIEVTV